MCTLKTANCPGMGQLGLPTDSSQVGAPITLLLEAQVGCASLVKPGPSQEELLWVGHKCGPQGGLFAMLPPSSHPGVHKHRHISLLMRTLAVPPASAFLAFRGSGPWLLPSRRSPQSWAAAGDDQRGVHARPSPDPLLSSRPPTALLA